MSDEQTDFLGLLDVYETSPISDDGFEVEQKYKFPRARFTIEGLDQFLCDEFPSIRPVKFHGVDHYLLVYKGEGVHTLRYRVGSPVKGRIGLKRKHERLSRREVEFPVDDSYKSSVLAFFEEVGILGDQCESIDVFGEGLIRYIPGIGRQKIEIVIYEVSTLDRTRSFLLAEIEACHFDTQEEAETAIRYYESMLGWEDFCESLSVSELLSTRNQPSD